MGTNVRLLRGVVPHRVSESSKSPLRATFDAKISKLRRLFSDELGCTHDRLVFDEINDVSCNHCGKDFTG